MNPEKRISVLLVEDHQIVREGLRMILETENDIEVIGEATNGRQAVALVKKLSPDVVVMDIAMPQLNGIEATRQIKEDFPGTHVIILSAHGDDAYIEKATSIGAAGFLLKQTSAHVLSTAIRTVEKGDTYFSPYIAKKLRHLRNISLNRNGKTKAATTSLTPRETEVLQLIAEGAANKQIAAELGISIKTVEKHRSNVMKKTDIRDTAGLTRYAIRNGMIESSVQITIT